MNEEHIRKMIENNKDKWFVQHIENHIKEIKLKGKVQCKICEKDIDTIAEETYKGIQEFIKKDLAKQSQDNLTTPKE